jgi:hypothetical protein
VMRNRQDKLEAASVCTARCAPRAAHQATLGPTAAPPPSSSSIGLKAPRLEAGSTPPASSAAAPHTSVSMVRTAGNAQPQHHGQPAGAARTGLPPCTRSNIHTAAVTQGMGGATHPWAPGRLRSRRGRGGQVGTRPHPPASLLRDGGAVKGEWQVSHAAERLQVG